MGSARRITTPLRMVVLSLTRLRDRLAPSLGAAKAPHTFRTGAIQESCLQSEHARSTLLPHRFLPCTYKISTFRRG